MLQIHHSGWEPSICSDPHVARTESVKEISLRINHTLFLCTITVHVHLAEAGIANEKKKRKFLGGPGPCPLENFESQD